MVFLEDDLQEFMNNKRIESIEIDCTCGVKLKTTLPVATSMSWGLMSHICKCGSKLRAYTFVGRSDKAKKILNNIVESF